MPGNVPFLLVLVLVLVLMLLLLVVVDGCGYWSLVVVVCCSLFVVGGLLSLKKANFDGTGKKDRIIVLSLSKHARAYAAFARAPQFSAEASSTFFKKLQPNEARVPVLKTSISLFSSEK